MSNIGGFGRHRNKELVRFLEISSAFANEVQSLCLGNGLQLFEQGLADTLLAKAEVVQSLDLGLIRYLTQKRQRA